MRSIFSTALFGALGLVGCSLTPTLVGSVRTLPCAAEAVPIAEASVAVRCPGKTSPEFVLTTDASGHFYYEAPAPIPFECTLVVEKHGFAPRSYSIEDVCVWEHSPWFERNPPKTCDALSLTARIAERREP